MPPADAKSNDLGRKLRSARAYAAVSLRRLAAEANLAPSTILRLERGETTNVRALHLQAIARALDIDVEELYVAAGLLLKDGLPELQPYLRLKYNLPDHAINQIDAYFQALRDRWHDIDSEEKPDDNSKEVR